MKDAMALAMGIAFYLALHPPALAQAERAGSSYLNSYVNRNYWYSIKIPKGRHGLGNVPPNPNHGVRIDLPETQSFIWVDGSSTDYRSADEAIADRSPNWRGLCGELQILNQRKEFLGGLEAVHVSYSCSKDAPARLEVIVALRQAGEDLMYTLGMLDRSTDTQNMETFKAVQQSFRLLKVK